MTDQPATAPPPQDPGHLLPPADWERVTREAERERQRIERGERPPDPEARALVSRYSTGLSLPISGAVLARSHGGRRPRGWPSFGVLHDAETPLRAGYAASIARYLAGSAVSAHYMVDPAETWGVLPDELIAWHCGTGNTNSLGVEQAGYARFSRAEWLTDDGRAQMARVAALMRAARERYGIGLFWMSDGQLLSAHRDLSMGGWATHDQCRRVLGGTVHTDPGPGYPYADLMALATQDDGEDDDMPTAGEVAAAVWSYRISHGVEQLTGAARPATLVLGEVFANARGIAKALDDLRTELAARGVTAEQLDGAWAAVPALPAIGDVDVDA